MKKNLIARFLVLFPVFILSPFCFGALNGKWIGVLKHTGHDCSNVPIVISTLDSKLSIVAEKDIYCEPGQAYEVSFNFDIKNNEVWKKEIITGTISPGQIFVQNIYWCKDCLNKNYIKINQLSENNLSFWINYDSYYDILSGPLRRATN